MCWSRRRYVKLWAFSDAMGSARSDRAYIKQCSCAMGYSIIFISDLQVTSKLILGLRIVVASWIKVLRDRAVSRANHGL
jgi:hypothetical protein